MAITVVIRVPIGPAKTLLALAEPALAVLGEAAGLGPLAPLAAGVIRREMERCLEHGTG